MFYFWKFNYRINIYKYLLKNNIILYINSIPLLNLWWFDLLQCIPINLWLFNNKIGEPHEPLFILQLWIISLLFKSSIFPYDTNIFFYQDDAINKSIHYYIKYLNILDFFLYITWNN